MKKISLLWMACCFGFNAAQADIPPEFRIKREAVFEFASKPAVTRNGDTATIAFETKGFCDVTLAVEDKDGRIVRHLASGVLGDNAPSPFQKNSKTQTVIWDGKNDQGVYIDDKDSHTIRVSLGLNPRLQRTLHWSPHRRISSIAPIMEVTPEGVYVFEGQGVDHLRLFDHNGDYLRTIYPFPAAKIPEVDSLQTHVFPQDKQALPLKLGFEQATLLSSGSSAWGGEGGHEGGWAATAMAVHPKIGTLDKIGRRRIALAYHKINRLASDGSSGGLPIQGPSVSHSVRVGQRNVTVGPFSVAFSPDGKYLYMTGYSWRTGGGHGPGAEQTWHMVKRMEYAKQDEPAVFLGVQKTDDGFGKGNDQFCVPTSVDTDRQGRIYVADFGNNRIQIFSPEGQYLKTLATPWPAEVRVDPNTDEIWVFSWPVIGPSSNVRRAIDLHHNNHIKPTVVRLGTFDKPVAAKPTPLPGISASDRGGWISTGGQIYQPAVNVHQKERAIWLAGRQAVVSIAEANWMGGSGMNAFMGGWEARGIKIFEPKGEDWELTRDFGADAKERIQRVAPSFMSRQRLIVNPRDGQLHVAEDNGFTKSFSQVLRINPDTGAVRTVKLPFDTEDMIFDVEGLAYLRTDREIVRFDSRTWREIPWDYGERRDSVGFASSGAVPRYNAQSALPIPGRRPVWWHSSGMWISPRRHLAVINPVRDQSQTRSDKARYIHGGSYSSYSPFMYPGRSGDRVLMVYDKHGKIVHEDAVPGLTNSDGLGIDNEDNLYIMVAAPRVFDGKRIFDEKSETLMKMRAGKARFLSSGRASVPLSDEAKPKRSPDITKYGMSETWVEGAEWMYGGVGYGGQGGSCTCWHARFQLDYFARSFAPEVNRYQVAVLDTAGNLILRIGRYGNVDDGRPLELDGGPADPRSIGGDEVSFVHAAYIGVHTDRSLYVHDAGNARILRIDLGYHAEETVPLSTVPDRAKRP